MYQITGTPSACADSTAAHITSVLATTTSNFRHRRPQFFQLRRRGEIDDRENFRAHLREQLGDRSRLRRACFRHRGGNLKSARLQRPHDVPQLNRRAAPGCFVEKEQDADPGQNPEAPQNERIGGTRFDSSLLAPGAAQA